MVFRLFSRGQLVTRKEFMAPSKVFYFVFLLFFFNYCLLFAMHVDTFLILIFNSSEYTTLNIPKKIQKFIRNTK